MAFLLPNPAVISEAPYADEQPQRTLRWPPGPACSAEWRRPQGLTCGHLLSSPHWLPKAKPFFPMVLSANVSHICISWLGHCPEYNTSKTEDGFCSLPRLSKHLAVPFSQTSYLTCQQLLGALPSKCVHDLTYFSASPLLLLAYSKLSHLDLLSNLSPPIIYLCPL